MYWIYCIYRTFGKSGIYLYAKYFIMSKMLLYHAVCVVQRSLNIFMHCMHHVVASVMAVQSAIYCSEKIKWPLAPKNWAFIKPLFEAYCYQFLLCDESYMEGEIPSLQPLYCNLTGVWPMACNSLQKSYIDLKRTILAQDQSSLASHTMSCQCIVTSFYQCINYKDLH